MAAAALRAPFAFRDWLTRHLEMLLGKVTASWPTQPQNIDQLDARCWVSYDLRVSGVSEFMACAAAGPSSPGEISNLGTCAAASFELGCDLAKARGLR